MPLRTLLRRTWHEKRLFGVLLLGICLVTGFFALEPLYVGAVSEASIRYVLENTREAMVNVTLVNQQPISSESAQIVDAHLGDVVDQAIRINRGYGAAEAPTLSMVCVPTRCRQLLPILQFLQPAPGLPHC